MFNLERSIAEWRRQMHSAGVKNPEILDELESHLRDDFARRIDSGEPDQRAFETAAHAVGQAAMLKREFAKLGAANWTWLRKLKRALARTFRPIPALNTFSPGALQTLELARQEAPRRHHNFIGTEHLLLGLLAAEHRPILTILKNCGLDRARVKQQIENYIANFPPAEIHDHLPYTPRVKKSLRLAATEAKSAECDFVAPEHILLGLLLEGEGVAARVLKNLGLTPETARREIRKQSAP